MKNNFIFGKKPIVEALERGDSFEKILVEKGSPIFHEIRKLIGGQKIYIQSVPEEKLNRITRKNHQGVIAFKSFVTYQTIEDILNHTYEKGETPLFLALDGVTDVGNLGAIARSAYALGAHGIIVPEKGSALINGVAVKASAGAIQLIHFAKVRHLKDSLKQLQDNGIQLVATTMSETAQPISKVDFSLPTCIILGNEETGVGKQICQLADIETYIPMAKEFDSLNVSVAAGIALHTANTIRSISSTT